MKMVENVDVRAPASENAAKSNRCFGFCVLELPMNSGPDFGIDCLHAQEKKKYYSFPAQKKRISYVMGRYCAKKALNSLCKLSSFSDVFIDNGETGYPYIASGQGLDGLQISIAHSESYAAAICYPEQYILGIDLEEISPGNSIIIQNEITAAEFKVLANAPKTDRTWHETWTAKEALSKAIKLGFLADFEIYEISDYQRVGSLAVLKFRYFKDFTGLSVYLNGLVLTIVTTEKLKSTVSDWLHSIFSLEHPGICEKILLLNL